MSFGRWCRQNWLWIAVGALLAPLGWLTFLAVFGDAPPRALPSGDDVREGRPK